MNVSEPLPSENAEPSGAAPVELILVDCTGANGKRLPPWHDRDERIEVVIVDGPGDTTHRPTRPEIPRDYVRRPLRRLPPEPPADKPPEPPADKAENTPDAP